MSKDLVHLEYSDANTHSVLNILISFNCLIDTDFGLLVLIAQDFFDTSVFNEEFFHNNKEINDMKRVIYKRKCKNPLNLCMKNTEDADDFYKQFFDKYYPNILNVSMITSLAKNLKKFASNAGATFTILCKDECEEKLLEQIPMLAKFSTTTLAKIENPDIYNQFFFKDYSDYGLSDLYKFLLDKKIYIGMYEFNKTDNLDLESSKLQTELFMLRNDISLIDLYSREDLKSNE